MTAAAPPLALPAGFFLLPISLTGDAPCQPHLYVKVHREDDGADDDDDEGHQREALKKRKTGGGSSSSIRPLPHAVFVVGLPLLWRPLAPVLESLFGAYGDVEAVAVHPDQVHEFAFDGFLPRLAFFFFFFFPRAEKRRRRPLTSSPTSTSSTPPPCFSFSPLDIVLRHRLVLLAKGPADPGERGSCALGRDAAPASPLLHEEESG